MERLRNQIRNFLKSVQLKSSDSEVLAFEKVINNLITEKEPSVPFASSVQMQLAKESVLEGQISELDRTHELPVAFFTAYIGIIFYMDVSRGTEWGEIPVSVAVNEDSVFVDIPSGIAIAEGKTNTLVQVTLDPLKAVVDTEHFIEFTIGDESFSQVRTLTVNVVADPE